MTEYPTLPQRLLDVVDRYHSPRAQIYKVDGQWQSIPAQEMLRRIACLSSALADLGVSEGDRVAVFAPNCPEWHTADFAITGLGAVVVPIYFREAPERIAYILGHSGAKVVFVAGDEQTAHLMELHSRVSTFEHIIAAGQGANGGAGSDKLLRYEALIDRPGDAEIAEYRRRVATLRSSLLASIIYTSGTTGEPKGVMLSHANFVANTMSAFERFGLNPDDLGLSFLPLAHVYERIADYGYLCCGIPLAYLAKIEEVSQALLEVRPTVTAAVPRFFEKLYATVMERGLQTTGVKRRLFDWAIDVARRSVPWRAEGHSAPLGLQIEWWFANRLVYQKFRDGVGGRIRIFNSGGAPLSRELAGFFTAVGMPILQGYGLTETSPVISTNLPNANKIGTVGRPIPGMEVRIADDGEIQVRGPCVMMGYYQKPAETRAVISPDGWLSTGDIGKLDADGYLTITDRKKEILKTAGGKMIAPAPIENALKTSPYILNAAVTGDKRPFIAALVVPNFAAVEIHAREAGLAIHSPAEIVAHPWVNKLIESEIARLTFNLAQYETIKRFALLERDFTFAGGELTYTLKLKRRVIEQRYADVIDRLYAGAPVAQP